ncbi:lipocalin Can f 6.0101-like [Tamandua tetradactyla]|uniref:lipocalin Can f 6.0101-like n=1 Tax=Tamandua tetradactyla TaxID=48850 RepID=UPI004053B3B2
MDIKTEALGSGVTVWQRPTPGDCRGSVLSPVKMKLLLLCLGLSVVYAHQEGSQAVVKNNFDMSKISGKWYCISLASDVREKIEENGDMRVFIEDTQLLANSSLFHKFHKIINGECTEIGFVSDKTEENGVYSVDFEGYNTFNIVETDYDTYIIYAVVNINNGTKSKVMALYGREPDLSKRLKQRFVKLCKRNGIVKENVLDLTKVDRCLSARSKGDAPASSAE